MGKKIVALLVVAMTFGLAIGLARAEDSMTPAEHKRLFREGAKLWPLYCNTCHNARPGSEKAPYEWDQIVMHMRALGNIPPEDTQAILEYLKAGR